MIASPNANDTREHYTHFKTSEGGLLPQSGADADTLLSLCFRRAGHTLGPRVERSSPGERIPANADTLVLSGWRKLEARVGWTIARRWIIGTQVRDACGEVGACGSEACEMMRGPLGVHAERMGAEDTIADSAKGRRGDYVNALRQADMPFRCFRSIRWATATSDSGRPTACPKPSSYCSTVSSHASCFTFRWSNTAAKSEGIVLRWPLRSCWAVHWSNFT